MDVCRRTTHSLKIHRINNHDAYMHTIQTYIFIYTHINLCIVHCLLLPLFVCLCVSMCGFIGALCLRLRHQFLDYSCYCTLSWKRSKPTMLLLQNTKTTWEHIPIYLLVVTVSVKVRIYVEYVQYLYAYHRNKTNRTLGIIARV